MLGQRDAKTATVSVDDFASRLKHRVQVTTNGHKACVDAIEGAFGCDVDCAMLVRLYGIDPREEETRYSPAKCIA